MAKWRNKKKPPYEICVKKIEEMSVKNCGLSEDPDRSDSEEREPSFRSLANDEDF
jgi:hypothetical protein